MRTLLRASCFVFLALAAGTAAYGLTRLARHLGPVIEVTERIDLGTQPQNTEARTEFQVKNAGGAPLELTEIATSCPLCIFIGRNTAAGFEFLRELTVQPGEEVDLAARIGLFVKPGEPFNGFLYFKTNDASRPEVVIRLEAQLRGEIIAVPAEVDLETLGKGQQVVRRIEIRDTGRGMPCRISKIESSDPALFQARGLEDTMAQGQTSTPSIGTPVSQFELVVLPPRKSGPLRGTLTVFEDGRREPLLTIRVHGNVFAEYDIVPESVVLPRSIGGKFDYSATWLCRGNQKLPVSVTVEDVPEGLTVSPLITPEDPPSVKRFRVLWDGKSAPTGDKRGSKKVRLKITAGKTTEVIDVPVLCWRP